jgi:hypothetical protein
MTRVAEHLRATRTAISGMVVERKKSSMLRAPLEDLSALPTEKIERTSFGLQAQARANV